MNKPYPNLNYEFYFLFKRDFPLNIQIDWPLNTQQGGKLYLFRNDKDKLVFRWDAAAQTLEHWQEHLQQGWVTIRQLSHSGNQRA